MKHLTLLTLISVLGFGCGETLTSGPGQARPALRTTASASSQAPRRSARTSRAALAPSASTAGARPANQEQGSPDPASAGEGLPRSQALSGAGAPSQVTSPLRLSTTLESGDGVLIARWTLTNEGPEPLYVATQLPVQRNGRARPSPHPLYVRALGQTLYLTKRLWRIPRLVQPLVRELPYLERLEPGQSLSGGVQIPPRVAQTYPYQAEPARTDEVVSEVVISFGFFSESAGPRPAIGAPGLYQVPYPAISGQGIVESPAHSARISVR